MRKFLKMIALCATLASSAVAQNKLFMNPIKYTDRFLTVYQSACSDPASIHLFINNIAIPQASIATRYINTGYWALEIDFGLMKPGDTFKVADDCNGIPFSQTVKDDFVYVEVPSGAGYTGNGIGPNDEYAPYNILSTPVKIGKCTPLVIDSHGLASYYIFSYSTAGVFLINGQPLTDGPTALNPGGYEINFNGDPGSPVYTINPDGSITTNSTVKLESKTHFSGQIPIVLEYHHDGGPPLGAEKSFGFKAMSFRHIETTGAVIEKAALGGVVSETPHTGTINSKYKITYDGVYYRAYIDNVIVGELRRFVEYSSSSGTLTPGSSTGLDYSTPVSWSGMNSGNQWVSALIDGVLYTRQQFTVADDMDIDAVAVDIACSGGNSGKITVGVTGGLAPLQYALNNGAYQASNTFNGLSAGSYTVKVRDASGCTASDIVTISTPSAVNVSVSTKTDVTCSGGNNGSVTLQATGGSQPYVYSKDGVYFTSSPAFSSLQPGAYLFTARDLNGCIATVKDTVKTISTIVATVASVQNVSCSGGNNGGFSIATSGSAFDGTPQYSADNGVTFQPLSVFTDLPAGSYTIVVKDNSCSLSFPANISQPDPLDITAYMSSSVSCNGLSDGVITASGVSGVAPYTFSVNGTQYGSSNIFDGLPAGNHKIWIKDANGCTKESQIVTVSQPAVLSLSVFSKTDVTCYSGNNGQINLSVSGGTAPHSFSKDGVSFQSNSSFPNLNAGQITLTVKDQKGCEASTTSEILQPADIILTPTIASTVSCFGGNNGAISVTSSGGTGLIQHAIDGTSFATTSSFAGLIAGSYQITARDAKGCTKISAALNVTQASQIIPVATPANVKCFGGQDGTVNLSATGGTGAYNFSKDGANYQSASTFEGLPAGSYTFFVKDSSNCVKTIDMHVGQPTELLASAAIQQHVLCFNGTSGILNASATGGTIPYQYSITGTDYQASATFGSLPIGTYKIWIKDTNGCIKESNSNTLTQPTDLLASIVSQTAVKCYAGNDGSLELAAQGGTSPYVYSRDATTFQATPVFSGLSASSIPFVVKDGNGCTKQIVADIQQPAKAYTITVASSTNLTCNQENIGRIEVNNDGGTAPYQVSLDNSQYQSSSVFGSLASGNYTVYGKDANNCTFTLPGISLSQPTGIQVSLKMKKDVDCEYYTKGEALLEATGSNGNFTYTLSGSDFRFTPVPPQSNTTGQFQNLSAGDYTIIARDQLGCVKHFALTIVPKSSNIRYEVNKTLPTTCISEDGSISVVNVSGGRPPYQYSISSQNSFGPGSTFSGLLNGSYIVTVADELCSYKKEVDLTLPSSIKATYTIEPISCETPEANLNITGINGGLGNYTLSLNNSAFSSNRYFANLHPNIYSLAIQDSPLTCKTVIGIEIKEQNRADLQVAARQDVLCFGGSSGSIQLKGDNNMGPFTYAINNGNFGNDGLFSGLPVGTYQLYARNRMGCIDSLRTTLVQPTAIAASFTKKDNDCFGDQTGGIELFATGGTPDYSYSINGTDYVSSGKFQTLISNNYTGYVRDAHGCIQTQAITVVQPPLLELTPMYQDTVRCFGESNGMISLQARGGSPVYQYSANGTDYLADSHFGNLPIGSYKFYVKDAKGCIKSADITLGQPAVLEVNLASKTDPLCFEGKDGSINVMAKGGNGSYLYTLDNGIGQSSSTFQNLQKASYLIKVTDRRGCTADLPAVTLTSPEKIVSAYSTSKPACFGESSGSINIVVSGGTPAYQAIFDGKTYDPVNNQFEFHQVKAATWPVEIKDQHGCTDKLQVLLEQPTALDGNVTISNNKCFSDRTGKIEVLGSGATPSYTYAIDNQTYSTNGNFQGLTAGSYTVKIKDAAGCVLTKDVRVAEPTQVRLSAINLDSVRCNGESNGSIHVLASGGTPGYTYSSNGLNYYSDSTFKSLKAGNYRFWVKDNNLCEHSTTLGITEPSVLNLSLTERANPLCAGEQNGKILITATGGNGGYVFWKDNVSQQRNGVFEGLTQASYTFKAVDRKGCEDTIQSVALTWPKPISSKATWTQPTCSGDKDASVTISLEGGVSPFSMTSSGLAAPAQTSQGTWKYTNLEAGSYTFTSTDANGCKALSRVTVQPSAKLNPAQFPIPEPVCAGQEVILAANNPGMSTRWFFNGTETAAQRDQQNVTAVAPGDYKLIVSNNSGCTQSFEYKLVNNNNALKADFLMTIQAFIGDTVTVLDISKPAPDEIKWELPIQAEVVQNLNTKLSFAIQSDGTYPIKMIAKKGDCINTKIRTIQIFKKEDIALTDSTLHYQDINLVQEMVVYPNPNFGKFTVTVKLVKPTNTILSISRATNNQQIFREEKKDSKEYVFEVDLKNFQQDVYLITIQAGKSVLYKRALLMN